MIIIFKNDVINHNCWGLAGPSIQLLGAGIHPRHCVIAHTEGIVTLTPCSPHAETYVNGQRLCETTLLQHGSLLRFGRSYQFRFIDPAAEYRSNGTTTISPPQQISTYERQQQQQQQQQQARAVAPPPHNVTTISGSDPILPAVLELPEDVEDAFLHALIPNLDSRQVSSGNLFFFFFFELKFLIFFLKLIILLLIYI